ncbi:MAG: hypothetical protein ABIQ30_02225 [Devosia sp.]
MFRKLILAAIVAASTPSFAQTTVTPDAPAARCLLASKSFSPGATIRASSAVNVCGADGNWTLTEQTSSGCFFADAFYSVGSTSAVSGSKTLTATCNADGTWSTAAAATAG